MNVKIFMCTHKALDFVPPLCIPVQGGASINEPIAGAIPDTGKNGNISAKNKEYCELTVQYYAYKNEDCDYYGFYHYRRFFGTSALKGAYITVGKPRENQLASKDEIMAILKENAIILPRAENVGLTAYEKYISSKHQFERDLQLFIKIVCEKAPFLSAFVDEYMQGYEQYFCNMFIMRADIFKEYSALLFSILEEFDMHKETHKGFEANRTDGYLGERFLGIYALYLKSQGVKIAHLPRIDAYSPLKKRIINKLLPPQSSLRKKLNAKRGKK